MENTRKITHEGELDLNGFKIPCYVLEDGTRVVAARGIQTAIKLVEGPVSDAARSSGVALSRFLNISWLKSLIIKMDRVEQFKPVFSYRGRVRINGYEATMLVEFCDIMLDARKQNLLKTERQYIVAEQCEILIRSLAKVGIIALVDEATGYQYDREKDELQKILKAYVAEDILQWQLTFYNSFYQEIFRLRKWNFTPGDIRKRPGIVGHYTIKYVYNMLPPTVFKTIKAKTPRSAAGNPTARYFQFLTPETGYEHLKHQIITVNALMSVARNWAEFEDLFARKFGQRALDFDEKPEEPRQLQPAKPTNEFDAALKGLLDIPPPPKPEKRKKPKPPKDDEADGESAAELVPS